MTEKRFSKRKNQCRFIKIVLEDDFGRTVTKVKTRLSPPMLMDEILKMEEVE